jgi:hypothetical protein
MEIEEKNFEEFDLSSLNNMMEEFSESQEREKETEEKPPEEEEVDQEKQEEEESSSDNSENEQEESEIKETEEPSSHDTKDSPLTPYAKMLVEEGALPNLDLENFDGSAESLLEAYNEHDKQRFESFKDSSLDPRVKWLQDNLENGVSLNKLLELEEKKFEVNKINEDSLLDDENLQRTIVKNYYKETTDFKEDKINKLVENLETLGELESESKFSLSELKTVLGQKEQHEQQQAQQQQELQRQKGQEAIEEFNKTLESTEEIIPGVKVSSLLKDRIKQTLTKQVDVDPQTGYPLNKIAKARMENPLNFEIKLAYLFELTKGFSDWSPLGTAGKRKAIDELEKSVESIDYNKGQYKQTNSPKQDKTYLEEMERISKNF